MISPILTDLPIQILALPDAQNTRDGNSRLTSADDAREALFQLLKEDEPRSWQRAIVKSCYDGHSPYSEKKRREQGASWMCNLNFQGLEGTVDNSRIPYYALFSGVPQYASFKTRYRMDDAESNQWNMIMEEEFTCLLNRWSEFKWHMQASQFEMIFEGWGPLMWEDDSDWRFSSKPARAVLVPQGSPSCLDKRVPYFAVKSEFRVHQLYDHIRNPDAAAKRGWNVEAVRWAIKNGTRGQSGDSLNMRDQPWEEWEKRWKNKELTCSYTEWDFVNCAHFFVREYSGKISHFIVTANRVDSSGDKTQKDMASQFLFKDVNRYDSYEQCMNVAFQNTGDGTWHSVRGIGLKSYKSEEVSNRLMCRTVDNAMISTGMVLQGVDAKSDQKMQLRINGPVSFIPPGTTMIQHRLGGDIEGALAVQRVIDNKQAQKIGAFNQRTMGRDDGRGEQPTLGHVQLAAAKEGSLGAAQIDNYYNNLDGVYSETHRRVMFSSDPEAQRYRDNCMARGVPKQAMDELEYVRANRLSGYGSPQMRKMAMQELAGLVPMMNEKGKNAALNEMIAASQGSDKVTVFNPPMDQPDMDMWAAVQENDSMHNGVLPILVPGMNNVVHLQIHLEDAEQRLAPLREAIEMGQEVPEGDLQQAFEYATVVGEHCEAHLDAFASDPSRQGVHEYYAKQVDLIFAFHGKLRSAIRSIRAQTAQEQRQADNILALDQVKLASAQQDMEIDRAKAQNDMQLKQNKAANSAQLSRWKTTQATQLQAAKVASDINLNRVKTAADVQSKKLLNGKKPKGSK